MTGPVFPEDSWVEVRYPLTSEQRDTDRAAWPWLLGWVVSVCGPDEWEICVQAPELAIQHEGEDWYPTCFRGLLRDPPARSTGRSGPACRARTGGAMSTTWRGPGDKHDYSILASSRPEPAGQSCRGPATATGGAGRSGSPAMAAAAAPGPGRTRPRLGADRSGGVAAGAHRRRRAVRLVQRPVRLHRHRPPPGRGQRDRGRFLLDLLTIVFTLLALGLSRAAKSVPGRAGPDPGLRGRVVVTDASAADVASRRSITAYAIAPIALAVVVDWVVAVIRRHVLAEGSLGLDHPWPRRGGRGQDRRPGAAVLSAVRPGRAGDGPGLRRMVLDAAPLSALPETSPC